MITKLIDLPVDEVVCHSQPRQTFDAERIAEYAMSMADLGGLLHPILVRREANEWVLIDGELRLRAAKQVGLATILAVVEDEELSSFEIARRQLIANQKVDLTPLEKARAIEPMMRDAGWSASDVATKLGVSPSTVTKLLSILSLPEDLQKRVGQGTLGLTAAYQLSLAGNAEAQVRLANELASGAITRDEAAEQTRARRKARVSKRKRGKGGRERITVPLGGGRSVAVAGPGMTLDSLIDWIADLLGRLKGIHAQGVALPEAVKLLASQA